MRTLTLVSFLVACNAEPSTKPSAADVPGVPAPPGALPPGADGTDGSAPDDGSVPESEQPVLLRLVAFGDYGSGTDEELAVSQLVDRLAPDHILTLGDNLYEAVDLQDERIGQYYHEYISPYVGAYGEGSPDGVNRFWPCLGNHDWDAGIEAWYDYFELPGNERYYTEILGTDGAGTPVAELFCIDSDEREPDGNTPTSVQGEWLRSALAASDALWKIVVVHHPAWSSGKQGPHGQSQWPFAVWGADLVLQGHDHMYERLVRDGQPFVTDGRGGAGLYALDEQQQHSQVILNEAVGASLLEVREDTLVLTAYDTAMQVVDRVQLRRDRPLMADDPLVRLGSEWAFAGNAAPGWTEAGFDDSAWERGAGQLGFGDGDESAPADGVVDTTLYLRHVFDVADPDAWDDLELELLRDDGAVVWLNGAEVFRSNLPEGPVRPDTLALADVMSDAEDATVTALVPATALVPGENVLAVEVHQADPDSSDLSFDLALRGVRTDHLVPAGADWSYLDPGATPPDGWLSGIDAGGWLTGPAPLGFGHADVATPLEVTDALPTAWLRTEFEVDDPAAFDTLLLRVTRDDGAVVWLNGEEVTRFDLPSGRVKPTTPAAFDVVAGWEAAWTETFVDAGLLLPGTNTLAVEVHAAPGSDSLRFDLELTGL